VLKGVSSLSSGLKTAVYVTQGFELRDEQDVKYVFSDTARIAKIDSSGWWTFAHDHLQTTSLVASWAGNVASTTTHLPFGAIEVETGSVDEPYKFTGKELEREFGLYYFGARYYNPHLGRWMSVDPLAIGGDIGQSLGPYVYCENDPFGHIDPDGAQAQQTNPSSTGPPGHMLLPAAPFHPSNIGPPLMGPRMDGRAATERAGIDCAKERNREERSEWIDKQIKENPEYAKKYYPDLYELYHGGGGGGRGGKGRQDRKRRTRPKRPGPIDRLLRRARRAGRKIKEKLRRAGEEIGKHLRGRKDPITDPGRLLAEEAGPTGHISPGEVGGKTPPEIDARARKLGLEPRGPDPMRGRGSYIDPLTGRQRVLIHPNPKRGGPHGHVNDPAGNRVGPSGGRVPANSEAAHLPIKTE
jgi:RHS repeat-associated protein